MDCVEDLHRAGISRYNITRLVAETKSSVQVHSEQFQGVTVEVGGEEC